MQKSREKTQHTSRHGNIHGAASSLSEPAPNSRKITSKRNLILSTLPRYSLPKLDIRHAKPEPWHSAKVVQHPYQTSLDSFSKLSVSEKWRAARSKVTRKTTISLRGRELTNPPKDLFKMTELETLTMSPERESCLEYKLTTVPKEIGNLYNLRSLVLDTNELKELPEEISNLFHLDTITLSNNRLESLPISFAKLSNLRSLHLANNRFTEIPAQICHLENLSFIDMSDNSIRGIPDEIDLLAPTLQTLLLFVNDITRLPDSFCNLTELVTLWLGKNNIERLPETFGQLVNLDWAEFPCSSNIDENPITIPPLRICRQGVDAIAEYFAKHKK